MGQENINTEEFQKDTSADEIFGFLTDLKESEKEEEKKDKEVDTVDWNLFPEKLADTEGNEIVDKREVVNLIKDLNLNPNIVERAIHEGNLPGGKIWINSGPLSTPIGTFIKVLEQNNLQNVDLGTEHNTTKFLNGIDNINKEIHSNNGIDNKTIEKIALETATNLT